MTMHMDKDKFISGRFSLVSVSIFNTFWTPTLVRVTNVLDMQRTLVE